MSFHKNKHKNNLNLTPRTHISIETLKEDNQIKLIKPKKIDPVDAGLKRLIFLGKIIKNYFPHKDNLFKRKHILEMKNSNSNKKMTPFQIYQQNKKLISMKLKNKRNFELKLRTVNSEKTIKKSNEIKNNNSRKRLSFKAFNSKNKYFNTIGCSFKNKLIKSIFEKDNNKNKINMRFKTFNYTESNFKSNHNNNKNEKKNIKNLIKFRYLLSNENIVNAKGKSLVDDLHYVKDKMILLNKNKIIERKKNINLFNELKKENSRVNSKTITDCNNRSDFNNIPLIEFSKINVSNDNFSNFFIKNSIKTNFFKSLKTQNNNL